MFFQTQEKEKIELYKAYLQATCSLSRLFSESETPLLNYRAAENIFCKVFQADNLSREDSAYDAKKEKLGIGIKTFIFEGNTKSEKVAEFNKLAPQLKALKNEELLLKLAELRNERINFANRNYNIDTAIYHCISRKEHTLRIFETSYDTINIDKLENLKESETSVNFNDDKNEYSFLFSKSTLFKKFTQPKFFLDIPITISENPFDVILELNKIQEKPVEIAGRDYVILPLYSLRDSKKDNKVVSEKSGLNQWNAGGRLRDFGEVYIPVPKAIHNKFPNFFPSRDTIFNLQIPSGEILMTKLCQDNSKALMTNPNNALADWILRKVLKLKEGELLTYARLDLLGVDSVRITKIDTSNFKIDFAKVDSYETFAFQNIVE